MKRKMHTPIDELQEEEDEESSDYEFDKVVEDADIDEKLGAADKLPSSRL